MASQLASTAPADSWSSGMQRDMGEGRVTYRRQPTSASTAARTGRTSSRRGDPVLAHFSLYCLKVDTAFRRAVPRSSIFTAVRGGSGCGSTRRSSIATRIQRGPPDRSHIQRGARVSGPRQLIHCAQLRHAAGRICRRISRCWRPSPDRRGGVRATARRRRSAHARRGGRRDLRHGPGSRPRRR